MLSYIATSINSPLVSHYIPAVRGRAHIVLRARCTHARGPYAAIYTHAWPRARAANTSFLRRVAVQWW